MSKAQPSNSILEAHPDDNTLGDPALPEDDAGFIEPVSMEDDEAELFAGDRGTLDPAVRLVLVRLLQRRFLTAEKHPAQWRSLLENQPVIESRLHDLYVRLIVDHERGLAYKQQVRSGETDVPILLRDESYNRVETLVLIHLRSVYQHEAASGETSARVDLEDIEQGVLTYFDSTSNNVSRPQREIRDAVAKLASEGLIDEESAGRYRITALVEIVLDNDRLKDLTRWLADQQAGVGAPDDADDAPGDTAHEDDPDAVPADLERDTTPDEEDDLQ